jgi:hypothetical protein
MAGSRPYRAHLKSSDDLVTRYEAIREGFVALALEKNRRATPFVEQARVLKDDASKANSPADLLTIESIQAALLAAAGVSDKAAKYLQPGDKAAAIQGLIENFLVPADVKFVEELVFRFLLNRGDTLGGSMRNVGGVLAQRKLSRALIARLRMTGASYLWLHSVNNVWTEAPDNDADVELHLRGLSWSKGGGRRTVIFNLTVPFLKNNVDVCLFDSGPEDVSSVYNSPAAYAALGELKGGIDPAGADEHWKTARTALDRIREAFRQNGLKPHTFFIGAAIAKKMAGEIWDQLEDGDVLENAANLMDEKQLRSISRWLCDL